MRVYEYHVKIRLVVNTEIHILLFHEKTLKPSNIPSGIRLKRAIQALNAAPNKNIGAKTFWAVTKLAARKVADNIIFVVGPAIDTLPRLPLSANPETTTAPGDITLK